MAKLIVPLDALREMLWDGLGIESLLVDDNEHDLFLRVTGYEGARVEFYAPITRDGMILEDSKFKVMHLNDNEKSHNRRDVTDKFIDLDDTFSVAHKLVELVG